MNLILLISLLFSVLLLIECSTTPETYNGEVILRRVKRRKARFGFGMGGMGCCGMGMGMMGGCGMDMMPGMMCPMMGMGMMPGMGMMYPGMGCGMGMGMGFPGMMGC
ncbi:hypothetical protein Y032_0065g3628 [Ancylostoma ceylanicum]|uniref:Uncharacterized protein n=1 Tax=Ancylostoma ceylanicum TaxID=53326 RepID=A0A016TZX1_9BILA|nr:hypothetical protein Y032_0065g3628 [Ancylostoma ceylanicum]